MFNRKVTREIVSCSDKTETVDKYFGGLSKLH